MKAMLFAAGKGTRLQPLTNSIPKALVKVAGISLLERAIQKLVLNGFVDIIINVHHFSNQIIEFLKLHNNFETNIVFSDESNLLLDTGGGLKQASWFLKDKPFLVYNVDVLTDLNLQELFANHLKSNALATLAVRERQTKRYLLVDENERLRGWKNTETGETRGILTNATSLKPSAFSGIHIIDPKLFSFMPEEKVFSIMDFYINICSQQHINTFDHSQGYWTDVGKPEELAAAEKLLVLSSNGEV
jgi:NDP-sugar pyrophosphorylase family protein